MATDAGKSSQSHDAAQIPRMGNEGDVPDGASPSHAAQRPVLAHGPSSRCPIAPGKKHDLVITDTERVVDLPSGRALTKAIYECLKCGERHWWVKVPGYPHA